MSHQKPTPTPYDDAPDAWLKGALLHAPDAQTDAPPALTHNILRESRLALEGVKAARRTPHDSQAASTQSRQWLIAAWNQLTRPAVAAGFASVMVATLVGVLWWEKPLDERGDPPMATRAPEVAAPVPAPSPVRPAPTASTASTASAAVDAPRAEASAARATSSRRSAPEVTADREALAGSVQSTAKRADEPPPRAKLAKPPQLEEVRREADQDSAKAEVSAAAAAAPAAAAAAAPTTMPAPVAAMVAAPTSAVEAAAPTQREGNAAFAKAAQDRSTSLQSASRAVPAPAAAPTPAPAPANSALITPLVAPLVASPLAPLLTALANAPEPWRWQADGGEPQAVTPALQRWLQLLERSAGSRWAAPGPSVRIADADANADASSAASLELRITSTGTGNSTRIVLSGNTVSLQRSGASPTTNSAVLTPAAADALRKAWAHTLR